MTQANKNNLLLFICIIACVIISIFSYLTFQYNIELTTSIKKKDKILNDLLLKDSVTNSSQKKYSENIEKYVQNCNYVVDGKSVDSEGIIRIVQKLYDETNEKSDSINSLMDRIRFEEKWEKIYLKKLRDYSDSISVYKAEKKYIEKKYSTKVSTRLEGDKIVFTTPINKLDSALVLLKYYKHKLKREGNTFTVEVDTDNSKK